MAIRDRNMPVYPLRTVIEKTGLTARQIRYYEQTNLISPTRSMGNRRLYSDLDIETLCKIKMYLASRYGIETIRLILGKR
jgi:MerR family glutamine synthetase transcriptional repressor